MSQYKGLSNGGSFILTRMQFRASVNRTASYLPSSVCFIDEIDHLMGEGSEARTSPANWKGWDHTQESHPPHSETQKFNFSLVYKKETLRGIVMSTSHFTHFFNTNCSLNAAAWPVLCVLVTLNQQSSGDTSRTLINQVKWITDHSSIIFRLQSCRSESFRHLKGIVHPKIWSLLH